MENQTFSYDEAYNASLDYFKGDELAARVWVNKYAVKDSFGNIYEKSPEDMHWRIANEVARIEAKYPNGLSAEELFRLFDHFKYIIPQGSPMTGIGNNYQIASLSNCFVIGLDGAADSYGAIIRIDEEQVQLMKRRFAGKELGVDFYRAGAIYGALFQLYARGGARRTPRGADDDGIYQASRLGSFHRCQDDRRKGYGSQCVGEAGR